MTTAAHSSAPTHHQPPRLDVDVLIVGAGISGIDTACHLTTKQPDKTFAMIDARGSIGGTWDLFKYPGIRSDSDLQTFGFVFKPWTRENAIAEGEEILRYLDEAIDEYGLRPHMHLGHKVLSASFSTATGRWTVLIERLADGVRFDATCAILYSAAGYYDHTAGYTPQFAGVEDFQGRIVHPQAWPEDLDYSGKRVVVIGSGATAVTIVPNMTDRAAHVTMLQRSPSYIVPIPRKDPIANTLQRLFSDERAYRITRVININRQQLIWNGSRKYPTQVRKLVRKLNADVLPADYPVDIHFKPNYEPWDQRLCMVPDSDLFKAISAGDASVVTDHIVRFTDSGILLRSGEELPADIVVTATGFNMLPIGGIALDVDGEPVDLPERMAYKSVMLERVPNFVFAVGYINNTWTLKIDLVAAWLCRLLAHMDQHGYAVATPRTDDPSVTSSAYIDMDNGYLNRGVHLFPKKGSHGSWTVDQNYALDRVRLGKAPIEDPDLHFTPTVVDTPVRQEVLV